MNELHQLVRDVMLKEFGDSRNAPLKAKPTTDPIQNIDVENIKALKNHVGEMIDKQFCCILDWKLTKDSNQCFTGENIEGGEK